MDWLAEPWAKALILKPFAAVVVIVGFFGTARLIAWLLWRFLPAGRFKSLLLHRLGSGSANKAAGATESRLQNPPILGRGRRKD